MDKYDPAEAASRSSSTNGAPGTRRCRAARRFPRAAEQLRDALIAALHLNIFARHADRVRMANIAQMINVLQAMIITDREKMVLTPTYHVFRMYVPFQDATFVPVAFDAGAYTHGDVTLPRVDASRRKTRRARCGCRSPTSIPNRPVDDLGASPASTPRLRRARR